MFPISNLSTRSGSMESATLTYIKSINYLDSIHRQQAAPRLAQDVNAFKVQNLAVQACQVSITRASSPIAYHRYQANALLEFRNSDNGIKRTQKNLTRFSFKKAMPIERIKMPAVARGAATSRRRNCLSR